VGNGKVITLPFPKKSGASQRSDLVQLDLFGELDKKYARVAVIEPSDYYEDQFLTAVQRFNISLIIDLRARPIFDRPNYSHKRITSYFFDRNIKYIDIIHLIYSSNLDLEKVRHKLVRELRVREAGPGFLGLCLVDQKAREDGVVSHFRSEMRRQPNGVIEVNPRAIGL
jgi:hypothetical protein|tara:strand:+ start:108 stop:614 length:507 start_codon:yes stop_codon:yes gene_type:complete